MRKQGWIILFSAALVLLLAAPGWAAFNVEECIPGLEIRGYVRNQTDIRAASPQDVMRCATSIDIHADYKPNPRFQLYLELRPFVDGAYDMSNGLGKSNRGVMAIDNDDYSWKSHAFHHISPSYGTDVYVGGHISSHDVLSTNMNTSYWLRNSFLREAWAMYKSQGLQVKVGKQIVTWGETDGMKLLDFINATDYSHFIIDSMEDTKIPEWMANITYYFSKDYNFQFLWIPWYVQNFQAPAGSAWAFNGVNLNYYWDHFDVLNIVNSGGSYAFASNAATIKYHNPTNQHEFAGRLKGTIGTNTDYTLNFFYTHQKNNVFITNYYNKKNPFYESTLDVFQLRTNPRIERIYGGSFNHVFDNFLWILPNLVMRGEAAFYYKDDFYGTYRHFNYLNGTGPSFLGLSPAGDLFITQKNRLRTCIGWDKNTFFWGHAWLLSVQTFWEHIFAYPGHSQITDPGLTQEQLDSGLPQSRSAGRHYKEYISNVGLTKQYQDEVIWTFFVSTDFMNQRIKPENLIVVNAQEHDGWNRFRVTFDISDHWSLTVGNNVFFGQDHAGIINPFVGKAPWYWGAPISGPLNKDAVSVGNIRAGTQLGEFSRNTSFFMDLKYFF